MAWQIVVLKTTGGPAWIREPTEDEVISLGSISDIRSTVNNFFDGTTWSTELNGYYVAPDESYSLEFLITSSEQQNGMTVDVRGGRESIPAIVEFARMNDLQLFDCSATWINLDNPSDEGWRGYDSLRRDWLEKERE